MKRKITQHLVKWTILFAVLLTGIQSSSDVRLLPHAIDPLLGSFRLSGDMSSKDMNDFLTAAEFSEASIKMARAAKNFNLQFSRNISTGKYTISLYAENCKADAPCDQSHIRDFIRGTTFEITRWDGKKYMGMIDFEGSNKMIWTGDHKSFKCHHIFVFGKEDLNVSWNCKDLVAKQYFKRTV